MIGMLRWVLKWRARELGRARADAMIEQADRDTGFSKVRDRLNAEIDALRREVEHRSGAAE